MEDAVKRPATEEPADEPAAKKTKSDEEGKDAKMEEPEEDERAAVLRTAAHMRSEFTKAGFEKSVIDSSCAAMTEVLGFSENPHIQTTLTALRRLENLSLDEQATWVAAGLDIKAVVATLKDAKQSLRNDAMSGASAETQAESAKATMEEVHSVIALIDEAEARSKAAPTE